MAIGTTFKFRRAKAAEWVYENPTLQPGEPAYELDTGNFKIGDGITDWINLEYFVPGDNRALYNDLVSQLNEHVSSLAMHPSGSDDGPNLLLLYQNAKV